MALIFGAIHRQAARPQASLDLIFQARTGAIAKDGVGASAQRKNFANYVDCLAQAVGGAEGTEVKPAVLHDLTRYRDSGPGMFGDFGAEIGLVVLEPDVVARPVLFDQVVLENQRFFFAGSDQSVEVVHARHQEADLKAGVAALAEIGAHPRAQRFGLAHVQHLARPIAQQIHPGVGRHLFQLARQPIARRLTLWARIRLGLAIIDQGLIGAPDLARQGRWRRNFAVISGVQPFRCLVCSTLVHRQDYISSPLSSESGAGRRKGKPSYSSYEAKGERRRMRHSPLSATIASRTGRCWIKAPRLVSKASSTAHRNCTSSALCSAKAASE